jgi:hypothetical protein
MSDNLKEDKIKKITEALYRVTNLFPDKEPLKWQLRNNALEIFDLFLSISKDSHNEQNLVLLEDLFHKINNLFQITPFSGYFIANANFEILKQEYSTLVEEIKKNRISEVMTSNEHSNGQNNGQPNGQYNGHNGQQKIKENKKPIISLDERKKQILALIKPNEWKTINEIIVLLPNISPKSTQRCLLEMVQSGILKKIGDKRWRKYSLV